MRFAASVIAIISASSPRALACAVCGVNGEDVSNKPFLQGTALLSLTPLIFIGTTVYYFYRRYQRAQAEEKAEAIRVEAAPLPRLGASHEAQ